MKSYFDDLRILLEGCAGRLSAAFAFFALSAAMDVACMAVLPLFVVKALSTEAATHTALPWLDGAFGAVSTGTFSAAMVALFVVRAALMLGVGSGIAALSESIRQRVVTRLVGHLLASPYEAAIRRSASDEITAVTHYSVTFSMNVGLPLLRLTLDVLTIATVLLFVAVLEPRAVAIAAAVFAAVALAYFLGIRKTAARQSRHLAELQAGLHHVVSQALSSPREVRVYSLERFFSRRIAENLSAMTGAQAWLGAVYWFPRALGELTLIGLAIAYMVIQARAGSEAVLVASHLSVLGFAGLRLLPAFAQGMSNLGYLQSGRAVTRILAGKLREADAEAVPRAADEPAPVPAGRQGFESLQLQDVSFRYAGWQADTLHRISFSVARGQSVGVVGISGAGKSTLGDLLLGLLAPSAGRILLNGKAASLASPAWWRLAGFVPQSPYIANDTLARNIAYGVPDAQVDLALVQRAVKLAQLEPVLARLPEGLETLLGDQGVRLSGGQRQRVAIARALYRQRDFLVLDEATSALDEETEREVIGAIEALKGTVTTFIIAHRLSTLRHCDFVIELREGRLVERPTAASGA